MLMKIKKCKYNNSNQLIIWKSYLINKCYNHLKRKRKYRIEKIIIIKCKYKSNKKIKYKNMYITIIITIIYQINLSYHPLPQNAQNATNLFHYLIHKHSSTPTYVST